MRQKTNEKLSDIERGLQSHSQIFFYVALCDGNFSVDDSSRHCNTICHVDAAVLMLLLVCVCVRFV